MYVKSVQQIPIENPEGVNRVLQRNFSFHKLLRVCVSSVYIYGLTRNVCKRLGICNEF